MEFRFRTTRKLLVGSSSGRFTAPGADSQACQGKDFDLPSASVKDTALHQLVKRAKTVPRNATGLTIPGQETTNDSQAPCSAGPGFTQHYRRKCEHMAAMKTKSFEAKNGTAVTIAKVRRTTAVRTGSSTLGKSTPMPTLFEIKSILVPTDFSTPSKKALDYAVPFAERFGAKLTLLHVVEPVATPDFVNSFPLMMENDKVMAACKAQLQSLVKQKAIDPKLVEKTLVRQGRAFHEIADAARTLKVDLIIISTHGYTGLKHALLGSTAERVVRHAPCPVLVVREREREFVTN